MDAYNKQGQGKQGHGRMNRSNAKAPSQDDRQIGARIRSRRMLLGLTQTKLADALGVTFQQVKKYERGINRVAGGRLQATARILGVSVAYFYDGPAAGGSAEPDPHARLAEALLGTTEGIKLVRAFAALENPIVRRKAVELIEALAQVAQRPAAR